MTALAAVLTWVLLLAPDRAAAFSPASLVAVPVEALLLAGLFLVLPARPARLAAAVAGAVLGVLAVVTAADTGFRRVLDRPVHLVNDLALLASGLDYVTTTHGRGASLGLVIVAAVATLAVPVATALCLLRLRRAAQDHRPVAVRLLGAGAATWLVMAAFGTELVPGQPVAAHAAVGAADHHLQLARSDLRTRAEFAAQLASASASAGADASATGAPLGALAGKDVLVAVVESYGRFALEDPDVAPGVTGLLAGAESDLAAAGFRARSAYLTSPTVGGASWLAHATLLSGVWVNNPTNYDALLASDRTTLVGDFADAGWRTVSVMPATDSDWPQGAFYGYDRIYDGRDLGYAGPRFSWSPMPDQFALAFLQRRELGGTRRAPVFAEVALTSSHKPWAPLPELVTWDALDDGSVFDPMPARGPDPRDFAGDDARVRSQYGLAVRYSLATVVSYLQTYGTDRTVLVLLGDHQPLPEVIGPGASRDVPVSVIARDPAVLGRLAGWDWQEGLHPGPQAPVWRMDSFRTRFVTAFSTSGGTPSDTSTDTSSNLAARGASRAGVAE